MKKAPVAAYRVGLALAAIWVLRRELHDVDVASLEQQFASYGAAHFALGLGCTIASFLLLGGIELLALRTTDGIAARRVPVRAALLTGFTANALSQSIGFSVLTGAAVRARAYARHGLDAAAVAQTTAFVTITATLGLISAGSVALVAASAPVTAGRFTIAAIPTALLLGAIVLGYLAWSFIGRGDGIGRGRWRVVRPTPGIAIAQVLLSSADWLITGAVLYAFMPTHAGLGIGLVLGTYMIAQTIGVTSHVPAGAGVFEAMIIALLAAGAPSGARGGVVAALVMFRIVYYLVPLCIALAVVAASELRQGLRPAARARVQHVH